MSSAPEVTVTIVSYNTRDLLRACLLSLPQGARRTSYEVHVVDNASSDGSAEMVAAEFPQAHLIRNTENVGFARANNQSWPLARGRYWFLLNSDAELREGALDELVKFADGHPRAALVSARLETPDGRPQPCADMEPTPWKVLLEASRLHKLLPSRLRGRLLGSVYFSYDEAIPIGSAWGTALLARREAVEENGPLDGRFWMYGEDVEWSLRMRRRGWEAWFCPTARVLHQDGSSWTGSEKEIARRARIDDGGYWALAVHQGEPAVRRLQRAKLFALAIDRLMKRATGRRRPASEALLAYHRRALRRPLCLPEPPASAQPPRAEG